jgi:flagellar hook-associated protein 2
MSTVSGTSSSGLNFTGLSTGIDTAKLVEGLTKFNQRRIDTLRKQQDEITSKQTAITGFQGKLFDLQLRANALARSAGSAFDGRKASSSDTTALTAAAGTAAVPGTYSLTVNSLAKAHQVASAGLIDPNTTIKQGTLTLQVGSGSATSITIDSRNNTLQGLADAVNTSNGEVRASIINDGSATPYRLLLTSSKTGEANAIAITNNLTSGTGTDINPATVQVQAAADAQVTLGSGSGALTVSNSTNQLNNLIPGTTLNLNRADTTRPIVVTVTNDVEATVKAAQDFVEAYNGIQDSIRDLTGFDPETKKAGILQGNRDVAELANDLASAIATTIPGLSPNANRLSSVGMSFDDKGKLLFNKEKFTQVVNGDTGVAIADLKKLFALSGTSDNPGVAFAIGSSKTKPTSGNPYQVNITQPATRAIVVATGPPAGTVTVIPANSSLQIKLNGLVANGISLQSGNYTIDALAAMIQQKINAAPALNGNLVTVGVESGKLQITSQTYGSASQVAITGGTALGDLGFTGAETATGTDVVGNFTANGRTEAATGSGQVLTGTAGNASTDGLQVRATIGVSGTANISVSQGLASRLSQTLNKYLDAKNGRFKAVNDTFNQQNSDIEKTITKQNATLEARTNDLQLKFAAMEAAVSKLKGVGASLTSLIPNRPTTSS